MSEHAQPWTTGGLPRLNIASMWAATEALGPGVRAVIWVQGCCFRCPGCISPEWIPYEIARLVEPDQLAEQIGKLDVTGLTISGGEPMLQAAGLARLITSVRRTRDLDVICFTGFPIERLRTAPPGPGVEDLLSLVDVLIDGPYIAEQNDNQGLRGSSNQRVHYLTPRLAECDLAHSPRNSEVYVQEGVLRMIGVPGKGAIDALENSLDEFRWRKTVADREEEAPV